MAVVFTHICCKVTHKAMQNSKQSKPKSPTIVGAPTKQELAGSILEGGRSLPTLVPACTVQSKTRVTDTTFSSLSLSHLTWAFYLCTICGFDARNNSSRKLALECLLRQSLAYQLYAICYMLCYLSPTKGLFPAFLFRCPSAYVALSDWLIVNLNGWLDCLYHYRYHFS